MALKPCKECGKEISTEATVCPHCGKKSPTTGAMTPSRGAMGCIVVVVVLAILSAIGTHSSENSSGTAGPGPASTGEEILKSRPRADSILASISMARIASASDNMLRLIANAADSTKAPAKYHAANVEIIRRVTKESRDRRIKAILSSAAQASTVGGSKCTRATRGRASELLAAHPEWSDDVISTVACGWVQEGLTKDQLVASWGRPDHINRSGGAYGIHEQWVYHDGSSYVYLEEGIVTSWQTTH